MLVTYGLTRKHTYIKRWIRGYFGHWHLLSTIWLADRRSGHAVLETVHLNSRYVTSHHVAIDVTKLTAYQDNVEVVQKLVEAGANVSQADNNGNTPMHACAGEGAMRVAQYFVDRGLAGNIRNAEGLTPLVRRIRCDRFPLSLSVIPILFSLLTRERVLRITTLGPYCFLSVKETGRPDFCRHDSVVRFGLPRACRALTKISVCS